MMTSSNGNIFRVTGPIYLFIYLFFFFLGGGGGGGGGGGYPRPKFRSSRPSDPHPAYFSSKAPYPTTIKAWIGKTRARIIIWCPTTKMITKACFLIQPLEQEGGCQKCYFVQQSVYKSLLSNESKSRASA